MKKHGRFVAGVFGASVLLALGTGAFLTANDAGAKEAKAAGEDLVVSITDDDFPLYGALTSFNITKQGVNFAGKVKTASNSTATQKYGYMMFDKSGGNIYNTSAPEGYYLSSIETSLRNGGSKKGVFYVDFGNEALVSGNSGTQYKATGEAQTEKTSNSDESNQFGRVSVTNDANVQFTEIVFTFSALSVDYNHISITGTPTRTDYYVGESFSTDGLTVTAYETAEDTAGRDVTNEVEWLLNPEVFESTDITSVEVMAFWNGLDTLETIEGITVSEPATVESIEVVNAKDTYEYGEDFDSSAITVYANMSDGKKINVTPEVEISTYSPTLADFVSGSYKISVSYGGFNETVDLVLTAAINDVQEFRASETGGIVVGTVTGITNAYANDDSVINIWINDETGGLLLYSVNKSVIDGDLAVGQKIAADGSFTIYNGLVEAENVTAVAVIGEGDEITPIAIDAFDAASLEGRDSSLINIEGLTYVSGSIANGTKAANVTVKYQGSSITLRAPTAGAAVALRDAGLDDWFGKIEDLPFNFVGHLGWFNAPQLAPLSLDDFDCPDFNAVEAFVDGYMHMDQYQGVDDADGACLTTYPLAKEAFENLSEVQQAFFLTSTYFADAAARYKAWAVANGEATDASLGVLNSISDSTIWIALGALLGVGAIAGAAIIVANKRRKAE